MPKTQSIDNEFIARFTDVPALVDPQSGEKVTQLLNVIKTDARRHELQQRAMRGYRAQDDDEPCDDDDNFWPEAGSWFCHLRPYNVKDGVLVIPVKGVLLSNFPYSFFGMATGYHYIWKAFERGIQDGAVRGIAFDIDSPGGEVQECFDCVDRMVALRGEKPVKSFANDYAYSAAYAIATVGEKINVGRTGGVGSIGVVTAHVDYSKMLEDFGVKLTFIFFGSHKVDGNPYEPLPASVKARIQKRIDGIGAVFVATVAKNRGMEEKAILATQALTYSADEALTVGLADSVGPIDAALAEFAASLKPDMEDFPFMANQTAEEKAAAETKTAADAAAARQKEIDDAKAKAKDEGKTEARERHKAIMALDEAKKRPVAAQAFAMDTEMPVEQVKTVLAKLPEEKASGAGIGNTFEKIMNESEQPNLGAGDGKEKTTADDRVKDVLDAQAASHGVKRKAA